MTPEDTFSEWLRRQGHQIYRTESACWFDAGPRVFQAYPYDWLIEPSQDEIDHVFHQSRAIAIRYSTPVGVSIGRVSYHVVVENSSYDLASLSQKARRDVMRGSEIAVHQSISMKELAFDGWLLRHETLVRQGRQNTEHKDQWEKMCLSAQDLPGFEAWGSISDGKLVAALLSYTSDGTVRILFHISRTDFLKYGVNNAITFWFTQTILKRPGIRGIFYGLQSLDAPSSVDSFKFRMGYLAKPVRQRVVFNPLIQPLVNESSYKIVNYFSSKWPNNSVLSKAEGMLRFYLQGKNPLSKQELPECLTGYSIEGSQ